MGSELREAFDYHLLKLTEHGILKRIYNRWPDTSRNEGGWQFTRIIFSQKMAPQLALKLARSVI